MVVLVEDLAVNKEWGKVYVYISLSNHICGIALGLFYASNANIARTLQICSLLFVWSSKISVYPDGSDRRYNIFGESEQHSYHVLCELFKYASLILFCLYLCCFASCCSFYVDNVPIREIKRTKAMGGDFPSKPMSLIATIWDGSNWATNGGKYKVNYKYAPYIAEFSDFILHGCAVDPIELSSKCDNTTPKTPTIPTDITLDQRRKMENFRKKQMQYSYCYDKTRYKVPPPECVIDPKEAERLRAFDPVTFGGSHHHHGRRHHRSRPKLKGDDDVSFM